MNTFTFTKQQVGYIVGALNIQISTLAAEIRQMPDGNQKKIFTQEMNDMMALVKEIQG